jgi:hypothetical protein
MSLDANARTAEHCKAYAKWGAFRLGGKVTSASAIGCTNLWDQIGARRALKAQMARCWGIRRGANAQ